MSVKELFDRVAEAKYPDSVFLSIAFKCEMYAAFVQRFERNAFDAVTFAITADEIAATYLAGPGGKAFSGHEALDFVACAVAPF
jgi:hypothetical protein